MTENGTDDLRLEQEHLFDYTIELNSHSRPAHVFGTTPYGRRIVGGVRSGEVNGPRIKASIIEGMDYGLLRGDDYVAPDVRLVLHTDDDELVLMTYTAGRLGPWTEVMAARRGEDHDPAKISWVLTYAFETGAEKYDWLNRTLAIGRGRITPTGFQYRVDAIG